MSDPECCESEKLEKAVVALDAESKKNGEYGDVLVETEDAVEVCRPCTCRIPCVRSGPGRARRISIGPGTAGGTAVGAGDAGEAGPACVAAVPVLGKVTSESMDDSEAREMELAVFNRLNPGSLLGSAKSRASGAVKAASVRDAIASHDARPASSLTTKSENSAKTGRIVRTRLRSRGGRRVQGSPSTTPAIASKRGLQNKSMKPTWPFACALASTGSDVMTVIGSPYPASMLAWTAHSA